MMMLDIDDAEMFLEIDRQAKNLANLGDARVERELAATHKRAEALFIARGETDFEAFFHADGIVSRCRAMVANHKRRMGRAP